MVATEAFTFPFSLFLEESSSPGYSSAVRVTKDGYARRDVLSVESEGVLDRDGKPRDWLPVAISARFPIATDSRDQRARAEYTRGCPSVENGTVTRVG